MPSHVRGAVGDRQPRCLRYRTDAGPGTDPGTDRETDRGTAGPYFCPDGRMINAHTSHCVAARRFAGRAREPARARQTTEQRQLSDKRPNSKNQWRR